MFPPGSEQHEQLVSNKMAEIVETEEKKVHEDPVFPNSSLTLHEFKKKECYKGFAGAQPSEYIYWIWTTMHKQYRTRSLLYTMCFCCCHTMRDIWIYHVYYLA